MASRLSACLVNALKTSPLSSRLPIRPPPLRAFCSGTTTHEGHPVAAASKETASAEQNAGDAIPASVGDTQREDAVDPFIHASSGTDAVFGRMIGNGRYTLKSDAVHLFEGCNLAIEDVKVDYNKSYIPTGMLVRFPSLSSYETAVRQVTKTNLYRLEKIDRAQWDLQETYNGKVVLLLNIPRNATVEDIERFLCRCNYDGSDIKISNRPNETKVALVRFPSQAEAMHAFRVKNHGFCLNSTVQMRVLQ